MFLVLEGRQVDALGHQVVRDIQAILSHRHHHNIYMDKIASMKAKIIHTRKKKIAPISAGAP